MQLNLVKHCNVLIGLDQASIEAIDRLGQGEVVAADVRKRRNGKFHRKFFALLDLAFEYWEPQSGLVPEAQKRVLMKFAQWLDGCTGGAGTVAAERYLELMEANLASKIEPPVKSREAFRREVIIGAGFYELVATSGGPQRAAKSISFSKMDEAEFNELYRAAFGYCWRMCMSKAFASEQEAENLINKMSNFA